ncbi:MAG: DUF3488 and transglutaminase-like domain-containing protein [Turicibacter sp.]|nr:DUF3488 and transglutaminase-like domain-containing protein [Turicibacter sp.]
MEEKRSTQELEKEAKKRCLDIALYLIIGSIYVFAVNLAILTTTIVSVPNVSLYLIGLGFLVLFGVMFWNRYTLFSSFGLLAVVAAFLYYFRERMEDFWFFMYELSMIATGYLTFRIEFTWMIVIAICLLTALFVAICLHANFHFYLMAGFGAIIFIICWLMEYPQSLPAFVLYLFTVCVLLVRKLQNKQGNGTKMALTVAPICIVIVFFSSMIPTPNTTINNASFERFINEPWEVIGELFFLAFNPRYFSFQSTGFTNQGGRLGGPISPNNRPVMSVDADRRIYLSGVTHNIYTGESWTSSDNVFEPIHGGLHPSYIEFMETASAIFRESAYLHSENEHILYNISLRAPISMNSANIFIGSNRMASLFRPLRDRVLFFDNYTLNNMLLANNSGDRRMTELVPRNTTYRFNFLDIDYRDEHIINILMASERGFYENFINNATEMSLEIFVDSEVIGEAVITTRPRFITNDFILLEEYEPVQAVLTVTEDARNVVRMGMGSLSGALALYNPDLSIYEIAINTYEGLFANYSFTRPELEAFDNIRSQFDFSVDWRAANDSGIVLSSGQSMRVLRESLDFLNNIERMRYFAEYANFVYENYLDLPDTLPQRVIDLAHEITAGYETNYEKILALQEFLIQFPYTLEPVPVPRDRDFVDFFLFDGQEGYCVYYASAMVVMSRAIGIPARYAEGFLMPPTRDPDTGLFTVTNRNAHAWAEIYFEGFGWAIIETTAPYINAMYERPMTTAELMAFFDWGYADWLDLNFDDWMYYWEYGMFDDFDFSGMGTALAIAEDPINIRDIFIGVAIVIAGLLFLYVLAWYVLYRYRLRSVNSMDSNNRIINYYREILKITKYWNFPILPDETTHEYCERLRRRFSFASDTIFMNDLNEIYYRARFSGKPLEDEEANFMRSCYYDLVRQAKISRSRKEFLYMKYIKGIVSL